MGDTAVRFASISLPTLCLALLACGGGDNANTADTGMAPAADTGAMVATAGGDGATLYARCATCHQANGEGMPGAFPPLAGSEWVTGNAAVPIRIVLHGMQGPIDVKGATYNSTMMPYGTGVEMTDAEVAAVVTYVRTSFGNSASAVTADDVARERAATSSRTTQWTADELKGMR